MQRAVLSLYLSQVMGKTQCPKTSLSFKSNLQVRFNHFETYLHRLKWATPYSCHHEALRSAVRLDVKTQQMETKTEQC